jgi:hypothetical protein
VPAERIRFSPRIGRSRAFEPTVISFDDVVGVQLQDVPSTRGVLVHDTRIDRRPVGGDLDGSGTEGQRAGEERPRSRAIATLGHDHIDHLAMLVDRTVEVGPAAGDLDVGLVDEPAITGGMAARASGVDELRGEGLNPTVDRHVIDLDAALGKQSSTSR